MRKALIVLFLTQALSSSATFATTESETLIEFNKGNGIQGEMLQHADATLRSQGYRRDDDVTTNWTVSTSHSSKYESRLTYRKPFEGYSQLQVITLKGTSWHAPNGASKTSLSSVEISYWGNEAVMKEPSHETP